MQVLRLLIRFGVMCLIITLNSAVSGADIESGFIKRSDVNIYYEVHGAGKPLLLIAGLASDYHSWSTVINDLSKNHTVIVYDNRGVGKSTPMDTPTSVELMCDDAISVLDRLGFESAAVVGHSMGGFIALDMAVRYPSRVKSLVLIATSARSNPNIDKLLAKLVSDYEGGVELRSWFREIFDLIFTQALMSNDQVVDMMLDYSVNNPHQQSAVSFRNQVEAIKEFDCVKKLAEVRAKTLLLCGAEDRFFIPQESIDVLSGIDNFHAVIIEGAAHSVHLEKPAAVVEEVSEFIDAE